MMRTLDFFIQLRISFELSARCCAGKKCHVQKSPWCMIEHGECPGMGRLCGCQSWGEISSRAVEELSFELGLQTRVRFQGTETGQEEVMVRRLPVSEG